MYVCTYIQVHSVTPTDKYPTIGKSCHRPSLPWVFELPSSTLLSMPRRQAEAVMEPIERVTLQHVLFNFIIYSI